VAASLILLYSLQSARPAAPSHKLKRYFFFIGNKFSNCLDKTLVSVIVVDPDLEHFYLVKYLIFSFKKQNSKLNTVDNFLHLKIVKL
jgi:hypothetical protein